MFSVSQSTSPLLFSAVHFTLIPIGKLSWRSIPFLLLLTVVFRVYLQETHIFSTVRQFAAHVTACSYATKFVSFNSIIFGY